MAKFQQLLQKKKGLIAKFPLLLQKNVVAKFSIILQTHS